MRFLLLFVLSLIVFPLGGQAAERKLKVNDEIQLVVFGEDSLGAIVKIDSSGSVNFPLVGNVQVDGKTAGDVAKVVEDRLEADYIRDANVTVTVVSEYIPKEKPKPVIIRQPAPVPKVARVVKKEEPKKPKGTITIMGEVRTPGTVQFEGTTVDILTIVAQARGLTPLANPKKVRVRRVGSEGQIFTVNLTELQSSTEQFFLKSGDSVTVSKRLF